MARRSGEPESSMSLLEILIAFVVAALSLGVVVSGSGTGLHSAQVAAHYGEALSRARSHLAAASVSPGPGQQEGDDGGGFRWRTLVTPVAVGSPAIVLYAIGVTVSWTADGGRREVTLVTQRLAERGAGP